MCVGARASIFTMKRPIFLLTFILFWPASSFAELGASSFTVTRSMLVVSHSSINSPRPNVYSIRKIINTDDVELHEFTDNNGLVFAMAWSGNSKPDMRAVLGSYYSRYNNEINQPMAGRRPVVIQDADLVVQTGGLMNQFFGVAFLPQQAPAGVTLQEIK